MLDNVEVSSLLLVVDSLEFLGVSISVLFISRRPLHKLIQLLPNRHAPSPCLRPLQIQIAVRGVGCGAERGGGAFGDGALGGRDGLVEGVFLLLLIPLQILPRLPIIHIRLRQNITILWVFVLRAAHIYLGRLLCRLLRT